MNRFLNSKKNLEVSLKYQQNSLIPFSRERRIVHEIFEEVFFFFTDEPANFQNFAFIENLEFYYKESFISI